MGDDKESIHVHVSICGFQASRGGKRRAPIEVPKKEQSQSNQVSNELFMKLKKRRGKQDGGKIRDLNCRLE